MGEKIRSNQMPCTGQMKEVTHLRAHLFLRYHLLLYVPEFCRDFVLIIKTNGSGGPGFLLRSGGIFKPSLQPAARRGFVKGPEMLTKKTGTNCVHRSEAIAKGGRRADREREKKDRDIYYEKYYGRGG